LDEPNAGGNSVRSEAYAMEILSQQMEACSVFTEMEVEYYYPNWKKCDFVTTVLDENVGVSVTRVLPRLDCPPDKYDLYVAGLLYKKLYGLVVCRAGTLDKCAFSRSILFAWTPNRYVSNLLQATFEYCADPSLKEDVELYIAEADDTLLRNDFDQSGSIQVTLPF